MDFEDGDVPEDLLAVLAALGDCGDGRALAKLDSLALKRKRFPTLAAAAKEAAAKIRARKK